MTRANNETEQNPCFGRHYIAEESIDLASILVQWKILWAQIEGL